MRDFKSFKILSSINNTNIKIILYMPFIVGRRANNNLRFLQTAQDNKINRKII